MKNLNLSVFSQSRRNSSALKLEAYRAKKKHWLENFSKARVSGQLRFKKTKSIQNLEALNRQAEVAGAEYHHDHTTNSHDHLHHHDGSEDVTCARQFRQVSYFWIEGER